MKRLLASILILLTCTSSVWSATRTFTYGGVNYLASTAGNWDTAPGDGDTIVIAAGSDCAWDVDTSGYATGIAGITITGAAETPASLYFNPTGTANYIKMKAGTTINGTNAAVKGRLIANSDGAWATTTVYPFAAKATIEFLTTAYLDGTYLSLNIRCAEPATPVITLSANEAIGQTELSVTEDITADIWADGDTVSICDSQRTQEHETRVIAAGGRAATTLTVTAGLTAAKAGLAAGVEPCRILLCTRNIKIIGGSGATQKCIANLAGTGHVVNAWMYNATAGQGYAFDTCVGLTVSGGYVGVGPTSTWASGWSRGFNASTVTWTGGTNSGNNYGFYVSTVTWTGGTNSGNNNGFYVSTVTWTGGTSSGNTYGFYTCTVTASNVTANNPTEFYRCPFAQLYTVVLSGATENSGYNTAWVPDNSYMMSKNHDGTVGFGKAWSPGGITLSYTTSPPAGFTLWRRITCESATRKGFHQEVATIRPGETLRVTGFIRIDADHTAYAPRIQIINQCVDPLVTGGAPLATTSIAVADGSVTTWQAVAVTYTNTDSIAAPVFIRVVGMHASENIDFAWRTAIAAGTPGLRTGEL